MSNAPLLSYAELERLHHQVLQHRQHHVRYASQPLTGPAPSLFRGRGMALEDLRPYQAGDEVRHIHWRATARSGRAITKVFRDERQGSVYIALDRSPSMAFGTRGEIKGATAARAVALLAWAALDQHETVTALVRAGDLLQHCPPARTADAVWPMLHAAITPAFPATTTRTPYSEVLRHLLRAAPRGATVILIGDFADMRDDELPLLRRLAERGDVVAVQIIDIAEEQLPDAGRLRLAAYPGGPVHIVDTSDATLRARYAAHMRERHTWLREHLQRNGVRWLPVYTHRDAYTQLETLL